MSASPFPEHSDESDGGSFSDGGDALNAKKHWLDKQGQGC
jgi:hypothetical protein